MTGAMRKRERSHKGQLQVCAAETILYVISQSCRPPDMDARADKEQDLKIQNTQVMVKQSNA